MPLIEMAPAFIADFVEATYRKRKRRFTNYVLAAISRVSAGERTAKALCPLPAGGRRAGAVIGQGAGAAPAQIGATVCAGYQADGEAARC